MVDSDGGGKVSAELSDPAYDFDPLREFYGKWNTHLAERYLPMPELFGTAKYECYGGKLVVSPCESFENSVAKVGLITLLGPPTRGAGFRLASTLNLTFSATEWIEPDVNVVREPKSGIWIPVENFVMPIEIVSPSSRRKDMVENPARCAEASIPYFMTVEVSKTRQVVVRQQKLDPGSAEYRPLVEAASGQIFTMTEPFEVSFDPARLLD
jgi:Uma2 family endonuclease